MRLGLVTTSYPRWAGDAAGSFVAGHAAYLRSTGAEVEVVAADDATVDRAWDRDQQVTRVPAAPGLFYAGGAPEALTQRGHGRAAAGFAARLAAAVLPGRGRWDAVAAHWLAPSALAALPTRGPLLAIAHGGDVHLLARLRSLRPTTRALVARGARVACVSRALAAAITDAAPTLPTVVQPMGVDDDATAAVIRARAARAPSADVTIAVLARLVPIKGVDAAIAALAALPARCRLVIAGDGPERGSLAAAARAFGVADRVTFAGWLDGPARDALLAQADVVCVPSIVEHGRSEGTPLVALEALAAGVPLVATATGGLVELGTLGAHLIPPGAPRALAEAISAAVAQPTSPVPTLTWRAVGARLDAHWRRPTA
ncbi:MAG: glycosyltransferase family 4 protein [Kofleriaceae bacterium]